MKPPVWLKPAIFILLLIPMALLAIAWARLLAGQDVRWMTADPVAHTTRELGEWSLRSLLAALAITPIARLSGYSPILACRRMVGLIAFTYVLCHWCFWMTMDLEWSPARLFHEISRHPYILFGMTGFLCLLPLAITSTRGWVKRMGARKWQALHRIVYIAGAAGIIHYSMVLKGNQPSPKIYAVILFLLLIARYAPQQKWARPSRR